ncbi:hypothetical protein CF140_19000 [Aeromonas sobria]|nr:hypothetical protein CF140_19000 [Aeromonas sobria]
MWLVQMRCRQGARRRAGIIKESGGHAQQIMLLPARSDQLFQYLTPPTTTTLVIDAAMRGKKWDKKGRQVGLVALSVSAVDLIQLPR